MTVTVKNDDLGRIAVGRIFNGRVRLGDPIAVCKLDSRAIETRVTKLFAFDGLKRVDIQEAAAGDIVCLAGIEDIMIGETIADPDERIPIPTIAVDEPTVETIPQAFFARLEGDVSPDQSSGR